MSCVSSAASTIFSAMSSTASMLMPARRLATLTDEQTRSVVASAPGIELIRRRSVEPMPFWTSVEKPPMKSMPRLSAARFMACAMGERSWSGQAAAICATGVTDTRLLAMGMPYSRSSSSAVGTRRSAVLVMRS